MSSGEVLITGGHVVTVDPDIGDHQDADVLVRDGRIAAVGRGVVAPGARAIDARGKLVLPGFVDTHRHLWLGAASASVTTTSLAGYSAAVMGTFAGRYRPEDIYAGTLWGALLALNAGVTTVADWAHNLPTPDHTDANIQGLADSGMRSVFLYGGPVAAAAAVRQRWPELPMGLAARGPSFSTAEETRADFALARNLGLPISVHAGMAGFPGAVRDLASAGLLGPDVNFAHANEFTPEEFALIAEHGGTISASPTVDLTMALGTHPAVGPALAHGIPVGLAADTIAGAGTDLFSEMRLALAAERSRASGSTLDHRDVLRLATHGGAAVWRLDGEIGTLTPGKAADIVVVDMRSPHLDGFGDPEWSMVLNAGPADVDTVLVKGRVVKSQGRLDGEVTTAARQLMRASRLHTGRPGAGS